MIKISDSVPCSVAAGATYIALFKVLQATTSMPFDPGTIQ